MLRLWSVTFLLSCQGCIKLLSLLRLFSIIVYNGDRLKWLYFLRRDRLPFTADGRLISLFTFGEELVVIINGHGVADTLRESCLSDLLSGV